MTTSKRPVAVMHSNDPPRAIALMGPTASGKTALALDWAERFGGEIVSVDSALVYRGLDIGAAKPDADERARAPHHMLDLRDPWQTYSAAEFANDARIAVEDILARGRVPILAGGTGMYFAALLDGLSPMPEADAGTRAAITAEAAALGWPALHAQLAEIDPEAAARIKPGDPQRIQRALEVHRLTGLPISEWQKRPSESPPFPAQVLALAIVPPERATLHARIATRFDAMLAAGFLDEVRALRALPELQAHPAPLDLPAIRAVGYRQAWEFLGGQGSAEDFRERGIAATRQLAKRQCTWLRGRSGAQWFDPAAQRDALDAEVRAFLD